MSATIRPTESLARPLDMQDFPSYGNCMTKTGAWIGKCCMCGTTYRAAKGEARGWCACRVEAGFAQTAINWKPLKARTSAKACDAACLKARSDACACECKGDNHGSAWHAA